MFLPRWGWYVVWSQVSLTFLFACLHYAGLGRCRIQTHEHVPASVLFRVDASGSQVRDRGRFCVFRDVKGV